MIGNGLQFQILSDLWLSTPKIHHNLSHNVDINFRLDVFA